MFKQFEGNVRLTVQTQSPLDEVFLLDSGLNRVAEGVGGLSVQELPAGLYKLKFKSGDAVTEQTVVLNQATVDIKGPRIPLETPVPLAAGPVPPGAASTAPATRAMPATTATLQWKGAGSGFFFYLHEGDTKTSHSVLRLARLIDESGDSLQALAEGDARCQRVDCPPGRYILRVNAGEIGYVEMCLPALTGWRTAVFMPVREFQYKRTMLVPDIVNVGILLSGLERDLEPADPMLRWTEQARLALSAARAVAPKAHLRQLLQQDWNEPMYLLFGAHLLLLEHPRDDELFTRLIQRLQSMLPGHPDVELLALYARKMDPAPPPRMELRWPPMLAPTWRLLQDPFLRDRVVIPDASIAAQAGASQWANSVWFLWRLRHGRPHRLPRLTGGTGSI